MTTEHPPQDFDELWTELQAINGGRPVFGDNPARVTRHGICRKIVRFVLGNRRANRPYTTGNFFLDAWIVLDALVLA